MRYTLAVTSCDRHDLLRQTLESFRNTAGSLPVQTIVLEDSAKEMPEWYQRIGLPNAKWIANGERRGQIYSCDRLWSEVKTDLVFWCEDDWEFHEIGFIQPSWNLIIHNPDIFTVNLRSDWNHPLVEDPQGRPFKIAERYWGGVWGGCTFNPGMRRRSDYDRLGSYGRFVSYGTSGLAHESALSKKYLDLGYSIASLPLGHCRHLGNGRSRAIEKIEENLPKILIAIPACQKFAYGRWESEQSPHYDPKEKAYGTDIHISGDNPRIAAIRDTWWNDLGPFEHHVDKRFFYGQPFQGNPAPDEVILPCKAEYGDLPNRTLQICRWALQRGYDYLYKGDDDTAVYVDRLIREILELRPDYAGYEHCGICTGGPGYILSKRAMRAVVEHGQPTSWAEDVNTGHAMDRVGIKPIMLGTHMPGFSAHWVWPDRFDASKLYPDTVTLHAVQADRMREWYRHIWDSKTFSHK
jgi:hypothetical protein